MKALKSCDSLKAPGYGGFNLKFIKKFWNVIGDEIMTFVQNLFLITSMIDQ